MRNSKFFRDPIHGYIEVEEHELKIVDHPLFQRLRNIHQLGMAYYVFHGANHNRFEHTLGVTYIAKQILSRVKDHLDDYEKTKKIVTAASLLHDIGHAPFSHTLEDIIKYMGYKDHEKLAAIIIDSTELKDILLRDFCLSENEIRAVKSLITGDSTLKLSPIEAFIIHSEMDADKMDYLLRDSYYCGVMYGRYDLHRILVSLYIHNGQPVVLFKGLGAVDEFILNRFSMYRQVYTHKTKRAFEIMLESVVKSLIKKGILDTIQISKKRFNEEELYYWDDIWLLNELRRIRRSYRNRTNSDITHEDYKLIDGILKRNPLRNPLSGSVEIYVERKDESTEVYEKLKSVHDSKTFSALCDQFGINSEKEVFVDNIPSYIRKVLYHPSLETSQSKNNDIVETEIMILKDINVDPIPLSYVNESLINKIGKRLLLVVRLYTFKDKVERLEKVLVKYLVK